MREWQKAQPDTVTESPQRGIVTGQASGVFVIDCDTEDRVQYIRERFAPDTYEVRTSRGVHFYFRMPEGLKVKKHAFGKKIEVQGDGAFVVAAGAEHASGCTYEGNGKEIAWPGVDLLKAVAGEDVPEAPTRTRVDTSEGIKEAISYLRQAEPSIQGANGSAACYRAAMVVTCKYGLTLETSLKLLQEHYNPRCVPPWSEDELIKKVRDASRSNYDFEEKGLEAVRKALVVPIRDGVKVPGAREYRIGDETPDAKETLPFAQIVALLCKAPEWEGVLAFDQFKQDCVLTRPAPVDTPEFDTVGALGEADISSIRAWFGSLGYQVSRDIMQEAVALAMRANTYHPIRKYLDELPEGDPKIFEDLARKLFGCDREISALFLRKFLISAVRRVRKPGCKVDSCLVLYSPEGYRKSTFVQTLFGADYTQCDMPAIDSKDAKDSLAGNWAVEIAEMESLRGKASSTIKSFITTTVDKFRRAYAARTMPVPRQNVFVVTTNDRAVFSEGEGRRWWPIAVKQIIPIEWLEEHRDAIWAAANTLERQGEAHWLTSEEEERARAVQVEYKDHDELEDEIAEVLARTGWVRFSMRDLHKELRPGEDTPEKHVQMRIGKCLRALGYDKNQRKLWTK